jgi:hypothetical protein
MKIRNGFVSNSSASSFCLYGWKLKPIDYAVNNSQEEYFNAVKEMSNFLSHHMNVNIYSFCFVDDHGKTEEYNFFGLGKQEDEIDHYLEDECWEDYCCSEPKFTEIELLKKAREEFEDKFKDYLKPNSFGFYYDTYWA